MDRQKLDKAMVILRSISEYEHKIRDIKQSTLAIYFKVPSGTRDMVDRLVNNPHNLIVGNVIKGLTFKTAKYYDYHTDPEARKDLFELISLIRTELSKFRTL